METIEVPILKTVTLTFVQDLRVACDEDGNVYVVKYIDDVPKATVIDYVLEEASEDVDEDNDVTESVEYSEGVRIE